MCKTLRLFYACMIICLFHFLHRDPRYSHQGVVRVIHNETGSSAGNFFQILSLDIIDFHLLVPPSLGVIGSQRSGFLKDAVRQLLSLGLGNVKDGYHLVGGYGDFLFLGDGLPVLADNG